MYSTMTSILPINGCRCRILLDAVDAGECKEFEGQKTVVVKTGQFEIPLYPPLFTMLQQLPVMENLRELLQCGQMKRRAYLELRREI